jgi:DinB superfamily
MKSALCGLAFAAMLVAAPAFAQQGDAKVETNPISNHMRADLADSAKNMVAAAEEMPADKYSFSPTPQQITFAHLIVHTAGFNYTVCSKLSGQAKPDAKSAETDGKDKLVAALKASYDFCTSALANADDSKLGESRTLCGTHTFSRGGTMMIMSAEFADHYSMAAMYLRLNGLLPPTAKK